MKFQAAIKTIGKTQNIAVITHENPDGDALGSAIALTLALQQLGKKVDLICRDVPPEPFSFLPNIEAIQHVWTVSKHALVMVVDCGDLRRTGFADELAGAARAGQGIINIDHHQKNDLHKIATINLVDFSSSSAAEIVWQLLEQLKVKINKHIATCLLTGIFSDTGGFQHSNTTPRVLEIASLLMRSGARLKTISDNIAHYKSIPALKIWGIALSRLRFHSTWGIITSIITQADLTACQAYYEDLAGCVNLINSVPNAKAAFLLCELPNNIIKVSLRTENNKIDVAQLASLFGGGGIKKAAGFSFSGRFRQVGGRWKIV